MDLQPPVTNDEFDAAVREIAREEGVEALLTMPGVWEIVSEELNNAALDRVASIRESSADQAEPPTFPIGDVQMLEPTSGDRRVDLLRAFYRGRATHGARAFVQGHGFISRDRINWATAGEVVTGCS